MKDLGGGISHLVFILLQGALCGSYKKQKTNLEQLGND